jgi:hypothetical protein
VKDTNHVVGANWREADATALEERVRALKDWLDHTEDLLDMFKNDDKIATELRTTAGIVRTKRNDFTSEAEALRARLFDLK